MNREAYEEIRREYDLLMSRKIRRKDRIRQELEARTAAEEQVDREALAEKMHAAFNRGDLSKSDLRKATRQYQSPNFALYWDAIPFEGAAKAQAEPTKEFVASPSEWTKDEDTITFHRTEDPTFDWDGVSADELVYQVEYLESLGRIGLTWSEDADPSIPLFNAKNLVRINRLIEEEF